VFVRDRPFDHENEILDFSFRGLMEGFQEIVSIGQRQEGIEQIHFWDPGNLPAQDVFDAGLRSRSHGNRIAVAAQARRDPQDVEFSKRAADSEPHPLLRGRHNSPFRSRRERRIGWSVHGRVKLARPAGRLSISKKPLTAKIAEQGRRNRKEGPQTLRMKIITSFSSRPPRCFSAISAVKGFSEEASLLTNRPG
jgi:hypothetical protein